MPSETTKSTAQKTPTAKASALQPTPVPTDSDVFTRLRADQDGVRLEEEILETRRWLDALVSELHQKFPPPPGHVWTVAPGPRLMMKAATTN